MAELYESLWQKINRCEICKHDDRIDLTTREEWEAGVFIPFPGVGPEPSGLPVTYLLVAQEPSANWTKGGPEVARKKIAGGLKNFNCSGGDFAIRWAAHNWLVTSGEGFLLTDLAKCSVPGKDAYDTMPRRYRNCRCYLNREVDIFGSTLRAIVPVGNEAYRWCIAAAESNWPPITKGVTHYARRFFSSGQREANKEEHLTAAELAKFEEFVRKRNPSRLIHEREQCVLSIYKAQFAAIKKLVRQRHRGKG